MDAERLIGVSRHALAGSAEALDVIAEACQAQALAQAIGHRLALSGPQELRGEARELGEAGGRGCGPPDQPGLCLGGTRAGQLSGVRDLRGALTGLGELLGEVGIALVAVACATDEEGLYWQCIEAIDAADESSDRVGGMLRRLSAREREGGRRFEGAG
ncbi:MULTISPECIES: DUF6099 family protein [unclassified Streptomyces]|uniref:DUF6099 family protein n=1 Tax=unclassified Streptomyces TaxID=2593676 RepID=UPI00081D7B2F|nr:MULTISPECIES: DUF6099 family protein [unclassified Streptomyces]MYZ34763.1 hypothetical protein [Streptomyces sp. SID4917]SCF70059.1 hypothetical protein GA0115259_101235 [Streptomyces sp. MnatMP-M17]